MEDCLFTLYYSVKKCGIQISEEDYLDDDWFANIENGRNQLSINSFEIHSYIKEFIRTHIFEKFCRDYKLNITFKWNYVRFNECSFCIFVDDTLQFQNATKNIIFDLKKVDCSICVIDNEKFTIDIDDIIFKSDETLDIKCPE